MSQETTISRPFIVARLAATECRQEMNPQTQGASLMLQFLQNLFTRSVEPVPKSHREFLRQKWLREASAALNEQGVRATPDWPRRHPVQEHGHNEHDG